MPSTPRTSVSSPAPTHGPQRPRRPTASIVIPAWNAWEHTEACLESLRPTLGVRDEVIVVDNGSTDATPRALGGFGWATVVRNDTNRGFAAACNQGAEAASGEIVVFLNSDTVPVGRWLDELLAPFSEDEIAATGPRSEGSVLAGLERERTAVGDHDELGGAARAQRSPTRPSAVDITSRACGPSSSSGRLRWQRSPSSTWAMAPRP